LLSSDIGKASIGTFKHRGVPAGTVLLEALYRVECLAPRYLETGQFIDQTPLRMLLTAEGKEVGDRLSSSFLAEHLQNVPTATSAAALSKLRQTLESLFPVLDAAAVKTVIARSANTQFRMGSVAVSAIRQPHDSRRRSAGHGTAS
jgi:ATP-dependent helicase HepA